VPRLFVIGNQLQWVGASELRIARGGGAKQLVASDIHHGDVIANEAEAVGAGRKNLVADLEMNLVQEVGLVRLLNGGGVSRRIHQSYKGEVSIAEAYSGRVASLNGSANSLVEDGLRKDSGGLVAIEDAGFGVCLRACGRARRRLCGGNGVVSYPGGA